MQFPHGFLAIAPIIPYFRNPCCRYFGLRQAKSTVEIIMVKIVARVLFFILLAGSASAQNLTWVVANSDVETNITFMSFPSHDTGYFAGVGSTPFLKHTIDSGQDYSNQTLPAKTATGGNFVQDMSWPTDNIGYISTANGLIKSIDGGQSWTALPPSTTLTLAQISFPSANIGYATGVRVSDGSTYIVAKTTDGGNSWTEMYNTPFQTNLGHIYFKDDAHGIFFAQDIAQSYEHVGYTTDGMAHTTMTGTLNGFGGTTWFISWNADNSWNAGYQGIQRSIDSGKTWKYTWDKSKDTTGDVLTGCYRGKYGFAFTEEWAHVLQSTDTGASFTWTVLPDSIGPVASAITATAAYVVGVDFTGHDVLMKTDIPIPPTVGVATNATEITPFAVYLDGQLVTFTSSAYPGARTIEIMDVLGRSCSSVSLASNSEMARMSRNTLRSGTYFAKLGNSCAKFTIPN